MNERDNRQMRTGAWYGDEPLMLRFPSEWRVVTHWPSTPEPLAQQQIVTALENPVGQPPVRVLCQGKKRPLIIVDDLNRPTPAAGVLRVILRQMEEAGISQEQVRILVATGTHGAPTRAGVIEKVGADMASRCRVLVHDCRAKTVAVGRTSAATPVYVNPEVPNSDFVIGIGGVYPNYTAGFGGGPKLALGVLGRRSILHLHYAHRSMGGAYNAENSFRRDLLEIADIIGLTTTVSVHVDEARKIVRLQCGDHRRYYAEAVEYSRNSYDAPGPGGADVVISNTYPEDLSLLFARMKGFVPLRRAKSSASLVAIARCGEGLGTHGLFPELERTRTTAVRDFVRRLKVLSFGEVVGKVATKMKRTSGSPMVSGRPVLHDHRNPIWVYVSGEFPGKIPQVAGIRISRSWDEILSAINDEQNGRRDLNVVVYPCSPLQCIGDDQNLHTRNNEAEVATAT